MNISLCFLDKESEELMNSEKTEFIENKNYDLDYVICMIDEIKKKLIKNKLYYGKKTHNSIGMCLCVINNLINIELDKDDITVSDSESEQESECESEETI